MNIYPFIEAEKPGGHNVSRACALLQVSRAAYAHRNSPSTRQRADAELTTQIAAVAGTDDRPAAQSDTSTPPDTGQSWQQTPAFHGSAARRVTRRSMSLWPR